MQVTVQCERHEVTLTSVTEDGQRAGLQLGAALHCTAGDPRPGLGTLANAVQDQA